MGMCRRCGGRLCAVGEVRHVAMTELYVWPVEWIEGTMQRCVNCGEYVDGVIEKNRAAQAVGGCEEEVKRIGRPSTWRG